MPGLQLTKAKIRSGVWQGRLTRLDGGDGPPPGLAVRCQGREAGEAAVDPVQGAPGVWVVRFPIPAEMLGDGMQVFAITERDSDEILASFAVVAGEPLDDDLRAEVELLRAELDMLKRAFRRHCAETRG